MYDAYDVLYMLCCMMCDKKLHKTKKIPFLSFGVRFYWTNTIIIHEKQHDRGRGGRSVDIMRILSSLYEEYEILSSHRKKRKTHVLAKGRLQDDENAPKDLFRRDVFLLREKERR